MLSHDCSLFFLVAKLDECISAVSILALLHLHHGKVTLVLEVVPDHLLSRGWLHPKQDHVATVGVVLIRDALCLC